MLIRREIILLLSFFYGFFKTQNQEFIKLSFFNLSQFTELNKQSLKFHQVLTIKKIRINIQGNSIFLFL